jgi:hypothetical protein
MEETLQALTMLVNHKYHAPVDFDSAHPCGDRSATHIDPSRSRTRPFLSTPCLDLRRQGALESSGTSYLRI